MHDIDQDRVTGTSIPTAFRRYFWRPPRAHGDIIEDRSVSFLELFYDLVYVVVIARAAHHLAGHVSWEGAVDFAIVFSLIWIAWLNGTLYQDLHGHDDGRSRTFVFLQMLILAVLAVFTEDATGADAAAWAITYSAFLGVVTWLWYVVRRQDDPIWHRITGRYLAGMIVSIVVMVTSAFVGEGMRLAMWTALILGWVVTLLAINVVSDDDTRLVTTDSTIERFGLFTIIVLGEVIVGVVEGISDSDRTPLTVTTGMLGLLIGFAFWWTYFDFVGSRQPRADVRTARPAWMLGHLPVTMAIAAAGAAMVSLVEHSGDSRTPAPTAWLITGSVTVGLLGLIVVVNTLADAKRLAPVYRLLTAALGMAAVAVLVFGGLRPPPWFLALSLFLILSAVWWVAIVQWIRRTDADEHVPGTAV
jgi:low temperature requirement protein LtrA